MKTNYIVWVCSLKLTAYFMNFLSKRKTTQLYSITVGKKKKSDKINTMLPALFILILHQNRPQLWNCWFQFSTCHAVS